MSTPELCARSAFFININTKILIYRGLRLINKHVQVSVRPQRLSLLLSVHVDKHVPGALSSGSLRHHGSFGRRSAPELMSRRAAPFTLPNRLSLARHSATVSHTFHPRRLIPLVVVSSSWMFDRESLHYQLYSVL